MAGYIFAVGGDSKKQADDTIKKSVYRGLYSTQVKMNKTHPLAFEGTFCDFISMKPGDNVYFFAKRKIYGVGKLISIGEDCKYCNYKNASRFEEYKYDAIKDDLILDDGPNSPNLRWVCFFQGDPFFFEKGIDIDEVLSYKPERFKVFRTFWNLSFIKLDREENNTLKEVILLQHQKEMKENTGVLAFEERTQIDIQSKLSEANKLSVRSLLESVVDDGIIKHEMALEAATIDALGKESSLSHILGIWDYVSHQVAASPFKPVPYMDKIDVFAMQYLPGSSIVGKYLVVELKKDKAERKDVDQVMKYTDWVCKEYAFGNYDAIKTCLIAYQFPPDITQYAKTVTKRYYMRGSHPVENKDWDDLHLITYCYKDGEITYTPVDQRQ